MKTKETIEKFILPGTEWNYKGTYTRDVKIYMLVHSESQRKYDEDPNNPDYFKGMAEEPFMLYVIESGFDKMYHTIIESPEFNDPEYSFLSEEQVKQRFDITLKE